METHEQALLAVLADHLEVTEKLLRALHQTDSDGPAVGGFSDI
jgi:hypothetical protein